MDTHDTNSNSDMYVFPDAINAAQASYVHDLYHARPMQAAQTIVLDLKSMPSEHNAHREKLATKPVGIARETNENHPINMQNQSLE